MDSMHDLGGRQGFPAVTREGNATAFHETWEVKINAIVGKLVGQHFFNMDEYRHAIERMTPSHYLSASYFERVYTSVVTLCLEKGAFTLQELERVTGETVPLAQPSKPGRVCDADLPALHVGDKVQVKELFVGGHVRMPAYVRGKIGRIVGKSPLYPFPDAAAHGLASPKQATFDVCFKANDLWSDCVDDAEVHVGLFHAYLEKVNS